MGSLQNINESTENINDLITFYFSPCLRIENPYNIKKCYQQKEQGNREE